MVKVVLLLCLLCGSVLGDVLHLNRRQNVRAFIVLDPNKEVSNNTGVSPVDTDVCSNWWSFPFVLREPDSTHGFPWTSNSLNSLPTMLATGTRAMLTVSNAVESTVNWSLISVMKIDQSNADRTLAGMWDYNNGRRIWSVSYYTASNRLAVTTCSNGVGNDFSLYGIPTQNTWMVLSVRRQGANAQVFTNGVEMPVVRAKTLPGAMLSKSAFSLGGIGNAVTYIASWSGGIADTVYWNYALSDDERWYWEKTLGAKYAITVSQHARIPRRTLIFDGDSITAGAGAATPYPTQLLNTIGLATNDWINVAVSAQTTTNCLADFDDQMWPYGANSADPIYIIFAGTNDLKLGGTAADTWQRIQDLAALAHLRRLKVVQLTILPRSDAGTPGSFEADRQTINTNIRNNSGLFDAIADVGNDATIGQAGDETNGTYYQDLVHLTTAGNAIIATIVQTALNGL